MPTPRDEARQWTERMTSTHQLLGIAKELPSAAATEILCRERVLVDALDGGAWIIRVPDDETDDSVRMTVYWSLVELLTRQYAPAAIDRLAAVRILVGDETPRETLFIRQANNQSKRNYQIAPGHEIVISPLPKRVSPETAGLAGTPAPRLVPVAGIQLPVTTPAWLLQALTIGDLKGNLPLVGSWLRSLVIGLTDLERVYAAIGKPVVFARIGELAREAGNTELADRIGITLHDLGAKVPSPSKTGRDSLVLPSTLIHAPRTGAPWLDRFAELFGRAAKGLRDAKVQTQPKTRLSRSDILVVARAAKREDTYHSTTIEGYRVSRDEVDAILSGNPTSAGRTPEEVERLMALKGYTVAFDKTLDLMPERTGPVQLTEALIHDINTALWWPSIDAGIVLATDLRAWRSSPAFIRRSQHVPPGPEKVSGLMTLYCRLVNELDVPTVRRAAIAHWAFETIHPYADGNGRIGRLIMNLMLGSEGWPWVTIVAEDRTEYFNVLQRAQVDEDFGPLGRFLAARADRAWKGASNLLARAQRGTATQ